MRWAFFIGISAAAMVSSQAAYADRDKGFCGRATELMARLVSSAAKPSGSQSRISDNRIETKTSKVEGFNTGRTYEAVWTFQEADGDSHLDYAFREGSNLFHIILKVGKGEKDINEITLDLPRGLEEEILDPSLLKTVLENVYQRAQAGDKFEIVINDPTIVERLNQVIGDTYVKAGELPYEPRRATKDPADSFFVDSFDWNIREDSYFPFTRSDEGREILKKIAADEDLSKLLEDALNATELGKAITSSGDWLSRVKLVENPKYKHKIPKPSEVDGEVVPVFPLQWRLLIESQW